MKTFSERLTALESADHLQRIELFDQDGRSAGVIENKPGSQGSLKIYHHLWKIWGNIHKKAAEEGLVLYAEHTQDAENHPGKHPNIDRLLSVLEDKSSLTIKIVAI